MLFIRQDKRTISYRSIVVVIVLRAIAALTTVAFDILVFAFPIINTVIAPSAAVTAIITAVIIAFIAAGIAIATAGVIGSVVLGVIAVIEIGIIAQIATRISAIFFIIIGRPAAVSIAVARASCGWDQEGQQYSQQCACNENRAGVMGMWCRVGARHVANS
jgi:hypothetical protein